MRSACILVFALLVTGTASAKPSPKAHATAMKKLGFLVGSWKGEGWIQFGPGKRETFEGSEKVRFKLGETLLYVEGRHFEKNKPIHEAVGIFSFDTASGGYRFHSWLSNGMSRVCDARLKDGKIEWFYQDPRSKRHIRFTISVENGTWHEVGESSADKKTWHQFFEMKLQESQR